MTVGVKWRQRKNFSERIISVGLSINFGTMWSHTLATNRFEIGSWVSQFRAMELPLAYKPFLWRQRDQKCLWFVHSDTRTFCFVYFATKRRKKLETFHSNYRILSRFRLHFFQIGTLFTLPMRTSEQTIDRQIRYEQWRRYRIRFSALFVLIKNKTKKNYKKTNKFERRRRRRPGVERDAILVC